MIFSENNYAIRYFISLFFIGKNNTKTLTINILVLIIDWRLPKNVIVC